MQERHQAFTLLELLIVLVIIGIVIAAASLMLSDGRRDQANLKSAVNLFRERSVLAQQQAILSTSTLGIAVSASGYQFLRYVEILPGQQWQWQLLQQNKVLAYHSWPHQSQLVLQLANQPGTLLGDNMPTQPQIIFYPSGQITAFVISANDKYQIIGKTNGGITVGDTHD